MLGPKVEAVNMGEPRVRENPDMTDVSYWALCVRAHSANPKILAAAA